MTVFLLLTLTNSEIIEMQQISGVLNDTQGHIYFRPNRLRSRLYSEKMTLGANQYNTLVYDVGPFI